MLLGIWPRLHPKTSDSLRLRHPAFKVAQNLALFNTFIDVPWRSSTCLVKATKNQMPWISVLLVTNVNLIDMNMVTSATFHVLMTISGIIWCYQQLSTLAAAISGTWWRCLLCLQISRQSELTVITSLVTNRFYWKPTVNKNITNFYFFTPHIWNQPTFASKGIIRPCWPSLCNSVTCHLIVLQNHSNPQKDLASLLVCNEKKVRMWVFYGRCHNWGRFRPFWLRLLGPGTHPQEGSISLKCLVETRLTVFDPCIGLLAFLVQKSWPKKHKIDNFTKICNFSITFEPETLESQSKAQKVWILVEFPLKYWAKYFYLAVGALGPITSNKKLKPTPFMTSPTKNLKPIFFSL